MRSLLLASLAVGASAWAPLSARAAARGAALRMSAPVTDEASAVAAAITGRMKERGIMPAPVLPMLEGFFATYVDCLQRSDVADEQAEFVELLDFYAGQAPPRRALRAAVRGSRTELRPSLFAGEFEQQLVEPFAFKPFHEVGARARAGARSRNVRGNVISDRARRVPLPPTPSRALSPLLPRRGL